MVLGKVKQIEMDQFGYTVVSEGRADTKPGQGAANIDPWAETAAQEWPLGTLIRQGDRVWRYCKNGGVALDVAAPVQQAAAAHAEQNDDIVCGAAAAIGDTSVEVTSTANLDASPNNVADDFAEGYLIVNDAAGQGHMYKIKSNEALSGTADSTFTLYPQESIRVALTTSSELGLVRNPYYKVIATTAVVSGMVVGVPQFAVTASYYFWCQTGGPAAVVAQAAIALGTFAVVGTTAAKVDPSAAATTELPIGSPMTPGVADTESCIVYLRLD
jgi:hypothetical protein